MANFDFSIAVRFDGSAVYISEMDLPLFLGGRWYVNNRYMKEWKSNRIFHRAVMGDPDGMLVDHINGNPLDNRRSNLRLCSHTENMQNRKMHKNNALGVKGVYADSRTQATVYVAQIRVSGKKIVLGRFDNIHAAALAYRTAAIKHHGDFARTG